MKASQYRPVLLRVLVGISVIFGAFELTACKQSRRDRGNTDVIIGWPDRRMPRFPRDPIGRSPGDVRHTPAPPTPRPGRPFSADDVVVSKIEREKYIAAKYSLPLESAEKLNALVSQSDYMASLGFSDDDVDRIVGFQMPSHDAIEKVGRALALSNSAAADFLGALISESRTQFSDVESPVWQRCVSSGRWETNANGGVCKSVDWKGCSPQTGASVCAPVFN